MMAPQYCTRGNSSHRPSLLWEKLLRAVPIIAQPPPATPALPSDGDLTHSGCVPALSAPARLWPEKGILAAERRTILSHMASNVGLFITRWRIPPLSQAEGLPSGVRRGRGMQQEQRLRDHNTGAADSPAPILTYRGAGISDPNDK